MMKQIKQAKIIMLIILAVLTVIILFCLRKYCCKCIFKKNQKTRRVSKHLARNANVDEDENKQTSDIGEPLLLYENDDEATRLIHMNKRSNLRFRGH